MELNQLGKDIFSEIFAGLLATMTDIFPIWKWILVGIAFLVGMYVFHEHATTAVYGGTGSAITMFLFLLWI